MSAPLPDAESVDDTLAALAGAYGVATDYGNWRHEHVRVPASTLIAVLAALGVDAATPAARSEALRERELEPWRRTLPPYVVLRAGDHAVVDVRVTHGDPVALTVTREDGSAGPAPSQVENWTPPREVDGRLVGTASFALPTSLPAGYHVLVAQTPSGRAECPLIVAPRWLGLPERVGQRALWGLATQLYSVRSRGSWGVGDLTDLTDLAGWAASEHDAAFVLVNPLHAAEPFAPMEPSPYLPATRRFANPLYLRVERIGEYADADAATRARIAELAAESRGSADRIDRDTAWTAKSAALALVHDLPRRPGRELAFRAFCRREGLALTDFAVWCVLCSRYGADWHTWPADLRSPHGPAVEAFATAFAEDVDFYRWLQWVLDEQLATAQLAARQAGMSLGIMHDLAVGVSSRGADAWAAQDDLARGITVGAPPDPYAQTGQDWNQPPWRPDRLAALAYAPFRDLVRSALRHSGGLRVDHIIGLFRLWWIPAGASPTGGTYVRYDHDAFLGILTLEAHRAGAVIVGEDLGVVEPWVRDYLAERGVLGTSILWFEFDWAAGPTVPLPPSRWREYCLAAVTTHDLPPTAGYLAGDHVRLRHGLGLLTRPVAEELAADQAEQTAWLDELRRQELLPPDADTVATVHALHRSLAAAPSRLRVLALTDAVGERRTQNQPGTSDEYPNWRIPLGGPDGASMLLEEVFTDPRAAALCEAMRPSVS